MLTVILLLVIALAGFCIFASDELTRWKDLSIHSWVIVLAIIGSIVICLFACKDYVRTESIKEFTEGKYQLEEVVFSDTTYLVKRRR